MKPISWSDYRNVLKTKADAVVCGTECFRNASSNHLVTLDDIILASCPTVRNLGVISDQDLSSDAHIKQVSAFFHLRNIVKIRNILSQGDAETATCICYFRIGLL